MGLSRRRRYQERGLKAQLKMNGCVKKGCPTIGLLLRRNTDNLVAEWVSGDIHKPIGISEYHITHTLLEELKSSLPSVEEIEVAFDVVSGLRP